MDESDFSTISGLSGIKYYSSNWASRASQNLLKCNEFKGRDLSLDDMAEERFTLRQTYITSDKFVVKESRLTCFLSSVEMTGIACIRQLFMLASKGGWEISLSSDEFYKSILERYADVALFVSVNRTHVSLDPSAVKIYSNAAVQLGAACARVWVTVSYHYF